MFDEIFIKEMSPIDAYNYGKQKAEKELNDIHLCEGKADKDNKKANVLVTFRFPDDSGFANDVDTELLVQSEIAKVMHKLVEEGKISHFVIGNDDVISEKLEQMQKVAENE